MTTKKEDESDATEQNGRTFPVVGIGASAGGLAAFESFFTNMPSDTESGMAFVLVQHLAPDHKSILRDLIKRHTQMDVFEVEDGVVVKPNCAYIIPPNRDMAFLNGALHLLDPGMPRGLRLPIDFFFRSLAQDQQDRAICIVLSGTGSDGTAGLRAIKGEGGMTMAQEPDSAEYDGMPRSVIATGLVDYVLPPDKMPAQLIAYASHAFGKKPRPIITPVGKAEDALKKILILLRSQTGYDFSQYKQNTIVRRVLRRMAVNQIDGLDGYLRYFQQTPTEAVTLFRDLLIGVTNFFRDPEGFETLEKECIPRLFSGKSQGSPVRVWVPGCSTGEEAYSIAILIQERLQTLKQSYQVQVFASDIDARSIAQARAGVYPVNITADVSTERLTRFFTISADGGTYSVQKSIRDMMVFSEHSVIKDPPFSRVDLISCRNMLIYMGKELQKRIIPLFHYALAPDGMLFLGNSESVGDFENLFAPINRKWKLYQRKDDLSGARHQTIGKFAPPMTDGTAQKWMVRRGGGGERRPDARACRTGAVATVRADQRHRQRTRRHPLHTRTHRKISGTGAGRGRHEHHSNGAGGVEAGFDERHPQNGGSKRAGALPRIARKDQRGFHLRQPDRPTRGDVAWRGGRAGSAIGNHRGSRVAG
jgi:two-component system CheB/CheR fusion protein